MTEFSIYQINVERDTANVCFIGMESLEKIKGTKEVNAAAYDRVYDGKMDCISLESIYQKFNVDHPADYKGRSLSVSDVVEIRESDTLNPGFYFVDSIGFNLISFDKSLCKEPVKASDGKISVLLVEPNKCPSLNIICLRWDTPSAPIPSGSIGQLGARVMNARSDCTGSVRNTPKSALHSGSYFYFEGGVRYERKQITTLDFTRK